jgi:hypothetical protein
MVQNLAVGMPAVVCMAAWFIHLLARQLWSVWLPGLPFGTSAVVCMAAWFTYWHITCSLHSCIVYLLTRQLWSAWLHSLPIGMPAVLCMAPWQRGLPYLHVSCGLQARWLTCWRASCSQH